MKALTRGDTLVIASHNPGKLKEIKELLSPYALTIVSAQEKNVPEPVEDGTTFEDNAEIKARAVAQATQLLALADDSGLNIHALGGQPGIYSARWAGPEKDFSQAMKKINTLMAGHDDKSAYFQCTLALCFPQNPDKTPGACHLFSGRVYGNIVWPPRGDHGFGYDPVFQPHGHDRTFAEMPPKQKDSLSHRAKAFSSLIHAFL